jgi:ABC-2 type transport system permease protein
MTEYRLPLTEYEIPMINQIKVTSVKYGAITLINLQNQLAYVWDALNRAFFIVLIMFVFVHLWTAVYEAQGTTEIAGLTLANTIWYLLIAEMIEIGKFRHDVAISEEVKDGSIAYKLIRPYNYIAYHFANGLGDTLVKMTLIFLLGMPIALYYAGWPQVDWRHLPLVAVVGGMALLLDFCVMSMIGLLAFVTEDTQSFRIIYQKFVFILGGLMIPLDFLPDWLQGIARVLPFNLTTYAPAKLFVAFSWAQFWQVIGLQLLWLVLLGGLLWRQYRWATQRLAVNGG